MALTEIPKVTVESPNASASFGPARSKTKRVLLRNERAEFGASTFSCPLGGFWAPNRDYAFEGLSFFGAANWKYLDALFFGLQAVDGSFVSLEPSAVTVTPFEAVYSYSTPGAGGAGCVEASYALNGGRLELRLKNKARSRSAATGRGGRFVLKPLVDIRFMYGDSAPFEHETSFSQGGKKVFCASRAGRRLSIGCADFAGASLQAKPQRWFYGLGSGERVSRDEFKGEERVVLDAGEIFLNPAAKSVVEIRCGEDASRGGEARRGGARVKTKRFEGVAAPRLLAEFAGELAAADAAWGREARDALAGRLLSFHNFFLACPSRSLFSAPDAGCFWFRDLWLRDALEGVRVNEGIYSRTAEEWLAAFLGGCRRSSLNGLLPTRFGEAVCAPVYDSVDSSLVFYPLGLGFFDRHGDFSAFGRTLRCAERFFDSLQHGRRLSRFAEIEDFLLKTPANCSWTDSVSNGVPNRLPREWRTKENGARKFFLVEVNALWLRFLSQTGFLPAGADSFEAVERSFKKKFFPQSPSAFPTHIAGDAAAVGFECSNEKSVLALEAAALLPDSFSDAETASLLERAKPLFVYRGGKLFGFLLREGSEAFLGDGQYHGGVVWPRETPYVASLLSRVGRFREVEELLLGALDHQQGESTLFYSNEVLSVDGENEIIPVKNPAQYWSNWVQPFFDYFSATAPKPHGERRGERRAELGEPRGWRSVSSNVVVQERLR